MTTSEAIDYFTRGRATAQEAGAELVTQVDVAQPLTGAMAEAAEEFEHTDLAGVVVDDEAMGRLYRYVRLRLRLESELATVRAQAAAMVRTLESRIDALDFTHRVFCAETTKAKLAADGARKKTPPRSFKTPFGTVGFRTVGGGVNVKDEAALLAAAAEEGSAYGGLVVKLAPVPSKAAIEEYIKTTGDLPPGVELGERFDRFYVAAPRKETSSPPPAVAGNPDGVGGAPK